MALDVRFLRTPKPQMRLRWEAAHPPSPLKCPAHRGAGLRHPGSHGDGSEADASASIDLQAQRPDNRGPTREFVVYVAPVCFGIEVTVRLECA